MHRAESEKSHSTEQAKNTFARPSKRFSPVRTIALLAAVSVAGLLGFALWEPGVIVTDGRHDFGENGIWIQHGWLGDDEWFERNAKVDQMERFRDFDKLEALAQQLESHRIRDIYPHLCPSSIDGEIAGYNSEQVERFLDVFDGFRVLPWVGGVYGLQARVESEEWRQGFVSSAVNLLKSHERLAGIQVNIEPMPSGTKSFLLLLEALKDAIPEGKLLSVAAYPPPTYWHQVPDVHWDEGYFREVAQRCDQMAVMMYDTALGSEKLYRQLMKAWTSEVLSWSGGTPILLGVPAYEDADVDYHDPRVENIQNAIRGLHAGLVNFSSPPSNYQGIAIYCEWEMGDKEWKALQTEFLRAE